MNGIERLILRRSSDSLLQCKLGQKKFQILLAGEGLGHFSECGHEMTQPMQESLLCPQSFMLATNDGASALKGFDGFHGKHLSGSLNTFNDYPSLNHS